VSAKITAKHDCIILDACVVMNLYASGQMEGILTSISETLAVAVYVMKFEALTVYKESKQSAPDEREAIQLQPFVDKGLLRVADVETDVERAAFLSFLAQRLDDGEAATMAIASNRNWAVATDDRLAVRVIGSQHSHLEVVSTPDIMKHWQEKGKPDAHILGKAIVDIEKRANFLLGRRHLLYEWWESCKESAE